VDEGGPVAPQPQAHLPHGFQKGQRFNIAHGAADFDNGNVRRTVPGRLRPALDKGLDFVGDVGNDLNRFAQVIAAPLFFEHRLVNLAGGEVVELFHPRRDEALVVAQVQIGFGTVFGDEHLAMLERTHGARVKVDVRVQFEQRDLQTTRFKNRPQRRGSNALTQGGNDPTRDKHIFNHRNPFSRQEWESGIIGHLTGMEGVLTDGPAGLAD